MNEPLINNYENIYDISNTVFDAQFLLSQADILITDYSSCYIDFLLRCKPIIFFQYDKSDYIHNSITQPGIIATTYKELERALYKTLEDFDQKDYAKLLKAKDFFYEPNFQKKTSGMVWDYIKKM